MERLQKKLNIKFKNQELYDLAFIHRSYLNEHKAIKSHNERVEFLGDAVLELSVTDYLYKKFPNDSEGKLTNLRSSLVKKETLAETAKDLGLGEYLKLSKGENESGGRNNDYILANTFEAFLGAIYLDLGYKSADKFVIENIIPKLDLIVEKELFIDAKTKLQGYVQAIFKFTPDYKTIESFGPDHDKKYTVGVYSNLCLLGIGIGGSKQNAQQEAAKNACNGFGI